MREMEIRTRMGLSMVPTCDEGLRRKRLTFVHWESVSVCDLVDLAIRRPCLCGVVSKGHCRNKHSRTMSDFSNQDFLLINAHC